MGEYMWGVTREKLSARECARRDKACVAEGGHGYTQINDPGQGWIGWFSGPNRGHPFDQALADAVAKRLEVR